MVTQSRLKEKLGIILQSSTEIAEESLDISEIWAGKIVIKDVPIK